MKITALYPQYITTNIKATLKEFSGMGFKIIHAVEKEDGYNLFVLENESGYRLDVFTIGSARKTGFYGVRVNVDNFEEGISYYESKGYKKMFEPCDFGSQKMVGMMDFNGEYVTIIHHVKSASGN